MDLVSHFCHQFLEVPKVVLAELFNLEQLIFAFGEVVLQEIDGLTCLRKLGSKETVLRKDLFV